MKNSSPSPYGAAAVRKGMLHFLSGKAIQVICGIGTMLVLVRWLPVTDYAAYITATAAASVMGTLSLFGMDRLVTRYLPEARLKADGGTFRRFLAAISLIRLLSVGLLVLVLLAGWQAFSGFFGLDGIAALKYPIAAFAILHAMLLFQTAIMQSLMLQESLRNSTAISSILKLGMISALVAAGFGLDASWALWIIVAAEGVGIAWMWAAAFLFVTGNAAQTRHGGWSADRGALARFALFNYLTGQAGFPAQTKVLQLVAAASFPPTVVAAYGFITTLADQFRNYLPMNLFRTMIEPVMIGRHIERQDMGQLNDMASAVLKANILLIVPVAIWLNLEGRPIIELLTGGKYGDYAWLLWLIVIGMVFAIQRTLIVIIANAIDRSGTLTLSTVISSIAVVLLIWMQLDRLGVCGLAISEAVFGFMMIVFYVQTARHPGLRYSLDVGFVMRTTIFGLVSWLITYELQEFVHLIPELFRIGVSGVLCAILFYTGQIIWKPFSESERNLIRRLTGRMRIPF